MRREFTALSANVPILQCPTHVWDRRTFNG